MATTDYTAKSMDELNALGEKYLRMAVDAEPDSAKRRLASKQFETVADEMIRRIANDAGK